MLVQPRLEVGDQLRLDMCRARASREAHAALDEVSAKEPGAVDGVVIAPASGPGRYTTMTLGTQECTHRFLLHLLPKGFHRIRHYGLLAGGRCDENIAQARQLLEAAEGTVTTDPEGEAAADDGHQAVLATPCPCCGGGMIVIETFEPGCQPRHTPIIRIDTS